MAFNFIPKKHKHRGVKNHIRIQEKLANSKSFEGIETVLPGIFPQYLKNWTRKIFFELNVGRRISDCLILFESLNKEMKCFVLEFKTTYQKTFSLKGHKTLQQYQFREGCRQLRDAVLELTKITGNSTQLHLYGYLIFFSRETLKILYSKKIVEHLVTTDSYTFKRYLNKNNNHAFNTLLQKTNTFDNSCTQSQRAVSSRTLSKTTGAQSSVNDTQKRARASSPQTRTRSLSQRRGRSKTKNKRDSYGNCQRHRASERISSRKKR